MKHEIFEVASRAQEIEKVCSGAYLLKINQVREFVKFMILSTSSTYVRNLSREKNRQGLCVEDVCIQRFYGPN